MIEVQNVSKSYGPVHAVRDISFSVKRGEILGFLGPNGAGKTTTMRILSCFMPATAGTARVAGYDVFNEAMEVKKRIGYLPENPPLYLEQTVDDFLRFVAGIKGVPSQDVKSKIDRALTLTSTMDVRHRIIGKLSKGFRQRIGLAQALIHEPEILILDEPTVGLDPAQIIEVRELIKGLAGDHTIILSTHILPEVEQTCDRVVIINKGQVVAEDTTTGLTRKLQGAASTVKLEAEGEPEAVKAVLQSVEGVANVTHTAGAYMIESTADHDIRSDLAKAIVKKDFKLFGLQRVGMNLEEIFLQLVKSENGAGRNEA
ncbi:MAG: ABC transporter ATP-binding protein [Candidatus Marinimicrobia bacterium]|nr:ABC transporter ATP-binding protein [Candidatus Neomarinimicrobiota bacterium]MCF7839376.1 ABC transporter ATP-binding protein [Candidatus Neomarinimicrobiota bacterium]MCF7903247.1 ABC transporter ATP-binding protein [Candidatus Neomarinimicrobiota bacterium]